MVAVVIAALVGCGGHEQPYEVDTDAGCATHSGTGMCQVCPHACDEPDAGSLTQCYLVTCGN